MRLVCISDTHNRHNSLSLPDGDVLVHAGDATERGTWDEVRNFLEWFSAQPHKHKVFIAGNHDFFWERLPETGLASVRAELAKVNVTFLQDTTLEIDHLLFYGSPWQPAFYNWAFNLPRGPELAAKWAHIPHSTDVLITHGPPRAILDLTPDGQQVGCQDLRDRVEVVSPQVHVFGHIHHSYGRVYHNKWKVEFVNAAVCDEQYRPVNAPIVVEL